MLNELKVVVLYSVYQLYDALNECQVNIEWLYVFEI